MAGRKNPIMCHHIQKAEIIKLEGLVDDMLFELDRAAKAGLEDPLKVNERREKAMKIRKMLQGFKREYIK